MKKKVKFSNNKVVANQANAKLINERKQVVIDQVFADIYPKLLRLPNYQSLTPEQMKERMVTDERNGFAQLINQRTNGIAPLLFGKGNGFESPSENSVLLHGVDRVKNTTAINSKMDKIKDTLSQMRQGFFETIAAGPDSINLPKKQKGKTLIDKVVRENKLHYQRIDSKAKQTRQEMRKAYDVLKTTGNYLVYDTETFGGLNADNISELFMIHDISYIEGNVETGISNEVSFVRGLTEKEAATMKEEITQMLATNDKSSKANVYKKALITYSGDLSTMTEEKDGLIRMINPTDYDNHVPYTMDDYQKGIDNLVQINKRYKRNKDGLTAYEEKMIDMINKMRDKNIATVTYNGTYADNPWMNTFMNQTYRDLSKHGKKNFLNKLGVDKLSNINVENNLDVLSFIREADSSELLKAIYNTSDKSVQRMMDNHSVYAQEAIVKAILGSAGHAHISLDDARNLLVLAMKPMEFGENKDLSLLDYAAEIMNRKPDNPAFDIVPGQGDLFMATRKIGYDENKGVMTFSYDPVSKNFRTASKFNIGEVGKDGKAAVTKKDYGINAISKGQFVTVDDVFRIDTNSEHWDEIASQFSELDSKELFVAKIMPHYNEHMKGVNIGMEQPSYVVAQSEQLLSAQFSANTAHVGKFKEEHYELNPKAKELIRTVTLKQDGTVVRNTPDLAHAVALQTNNMIADKTRRSISEVSYARYSKFKEFDKVATEVLGANYDIKEAQELFSKMAMSNDAEIAFQVATGKVIKVNPAMLQNVLKAKDMATRNEVDNLKHAFSYFKEIEPLADVVKSELDNIYGTMSDKMSYENKAAYKLAFEKSMKEVLTQASGRLVEDSKGSLDIRKAYLNNLSDTEVFVRDVSGFTFEMPNLLKKPTGWLESPLSVTDSNKNITFNLEGDLYGVKRTITEALNPNSKSTGVAKKREELIALKQFVMEANKNSNYRGIFSDVIKDERSMNDGDILASDILETLRKRREKNPSAGLNTNIMIQDIDTGHAAIQYVKDVYGDKIQDFVSPIVRQQPRVFAVGQNYKVNDDIINDMIDNYLIDLKIDGEKYSDPLKYIQAIGHSGVEAEYFTNNVKQTRQAYKSFIQDYIQTNSVGGKLDFVYDYNTHKLLGKAAGEEVFDVTSQLPRVVGRGVNIHAEQGNMKMAFRGILNMEDFARGDNLDPTKVTIQSNIEYALHHAQLDMKRRAGKVQEAGEQARDAAYTLKSVGEYLHGNRKNRKTGTTHISPTTGWSEKESLSFLQLDKRDIYSHLKQIAEMDSMQDKKFVTKDILKVLKESSDFTVESMSNKLSNSQMKALNHMMQELFKVNPSVYNTIMNLNESAAKHTELHKGISYVGGVHLNSLLGNNGSRPVPTSATLRRSVKETDKAVELLRQSGFAARRENIFDLDVSHKRKKVKVYGVGEVTDTIHVEKANLSDFGYKLLLAKHMDGNDSIHPAVLNKLKAVNLTEQEKVVDGRAADILFTKQQIQKLPMPTENPKYSEYIDNFQEAVYGLKTVNKNGKQQVVFNYNKHGKVFNSKDLVGFKDGYGGTEAIVANFDGRLKMGVFSEGMLVGEDDINKLLKNATSVEQARKLLHDNFETSFYLDRIDDVGFIKLINGGVEKDMTNKLLLGVGSIDNNVADFFTAIGKAKDASSNRIYQYDELNTLIDENFSAYQKARGKRALPKKELRERIFAERYAASDELQRLLNNGEMPERRVALVANHEIAKHGSQMLNIDETLASIQQTIIDDATNKAKTPAEAAALLKGKLDDYKVFSFDEGVKLDNGTLVFPQDWNGTNKDGSLRGINIKNFKEMLKKENYIQNISSEDSMTAGRLLTIEGMDDTVALGSIVMSSVAEADDYQGMSTSQSYTLESKKLDGKIQEIATRIKSLGKEDVALKRQYYNYMDELKEQKRALVAAINDKQRGRSYGKRDIQMLNMQKYDTGFNKTLLRALTTDGKLDEARYLQIMDNKIKRDAHGVPVRDRYGNYVLKDGSKSHSVLKRWTDEIKGRVPLGGPGEEILVNDKKLGKKMLKYYADPETRKAITNIVKNEGKVSKDYAESIYALKSGIDASKFNTGLVRKLNKNTGSMELTPARERGIADIEELEKRGFKRMSLEEVVSQGDLDAKSVVDDPNSIFKKNIILDLGDEVEDETRYIAMPFVSNKATLGDEDSAGHIIQRNFQKHMVGLQNRKEALIDLIRDGADAETIQKAKDAIQDSSEEMRKEIYLDTLGKRGVLGQLGSYKAEYSVNAKTSSFVYMDDKMFGHIKYSKEKEEAVSLAKQYLTGDDFNYAALDVATIGGKTLKEHYQEGRYFNTRFSGLQVFEEMGILTPEFAKNTISQKDIDRYRGGSNISPDFDDLDENAQRMEVLRHRLKTEGVMVDTVRYPTIKDGSTGPAMMFLDDNIDGLVTKVGIEGQLGFTGDNDGDHVASALIFKKDHKGRMITSLNQHSDKMFLENYGFMYSRAAGANRYWREEAENTIYKAINTAKTNGDISAIQSGDYLLNTYVGVAPLEDVNKQRDTLEEFLDMMNEQTDSNYSVADIHNQKNLPAFDDFLNTIEDTDSRKRYLEAYGFERQHGKMFMDMHAKDNLHYTGHVNVPLFRKREIMDLRMFSDPNADPADQQLLNKAFGTIEQKVISSKKMEYSDPAVESFSAIEEKMDTFTTALNNLVYNPDQGKDQMHKWLRDNKDVRDGLVENAKELMKSDQFDSNLQERYDDVVKRLSNELVGDDLKIAEEEYANVVGDIETYMEDKVVSSLSALNSDQIKSMNDRYRLGTAMDYYDGTNLQSVARFKGDNGLIDEALGRAQKVGADIETVSEYAFRTDRSHAFETLERETRAFAGDVLEDSGQGKKKVLESTLEALTRTKSSGLGVGALTVAASIIAVGAMGGNPSQATGMEAAENAQVGINDLDMMASQSTSQPQYTNTGYVINVRGKGNRASINRASHQMANTMSNSFSSDVNINMNISEDGSSINDRFLEEIISDAIR